MACSGLGSGCAAAGFALVPGGDRTSERASPGGADGARDALDAGRCVASDSDAVAGGWTSGARTAAGVVRLRERPRGVGRHELGVSRRVQERAEHRPGAGRVTDRDDALVQIDHDALAIARDAQVRAVHGDARALDVDRERLARSHGDHLRLDGPALEREDQGALHVRHDRLRSRLECQRHLPGALDGRACALGLEDIAEPQAGPARRRAFRR